MSIKMRMKKGVGTIKTNFGLVKDSAKLIRANRTSISDGDSLKAVRLRRLVKESSIPKPIKNAIRTRLSRVIAKHLRRGPMWSALREEIEYLEKQKGRKLTDKEIEQEWHKWNDAHANC